VIRDCWYVVLDSREVPRDKPVAFRRLGDDLVFWRDREGNVACAVDRCPHRGAQLSAGKVVDGCVECFFHGFRFDDAGACQLIPANGLKAPIPRAMRVRSFACREQGGFVYLWWGERRDAYPPLPSFDKPNDRFAYAQLHEDWPAHISRVVENQLDFTHLPFTHASTIGRGVPGELGVNTEVDGDRIRVKYDPEVYDGAKGFFVELHAPNLWRNRLSDRVWVLAAFVPIDEDNTRTYIRFCQDFVTVPGLGWLFCWLSNVFNKIVLGQDRKRVISQRPKKTQLDMDEVLVPSDRPIIEYRRWVDARTDRNEPAAPNASDGAPTST